MVGVEDQRRAGGLTDGQQVLRAVGALVVFQAQAQAGTVGQVRDDRGEFGRPPPLATMQQQQVPGRARKAEAVKRIGVRGDSTMPQDEMAVAFYSALGTTLKQRFAGWTVFLFTADLSLPKLLRLKEARKTPFFNGAIECRLFRFDMVAGFNRREEAKPKG